MIMDQFLKGIGILVIVGVALYLAGIIKNIPEVKDIPYVGELELSDNCFRYKHIHNQWYDLSIRFDISDNAEYSDGKLEIYYAMRIEKSGCELSGEAYKVKDIVTDSTNTDIETTYDREQIPLNISGQIDEGHMKLELSHQTISNNDCRVNISLPLSRYDIHDIRGTFTEECDNGSGTVKILERTEYY